MDPRGLDDPYKTGRGVGRIVQAWRNSGAGLAAAWREESSFRQLVILAAVLVPVACWVDVHAAERALLIGSVLFTLVVELVNSAIEAAIDRISLERHPLSKRAKDMGSAAVLVSLAMLAIVWGLILWPLVV